MTSLRKKVEQLTETVEHLTEELAELKLELKERWAEIEADPEYDISSLGRVRKRKNGFEPKFTLNKSTGYYHVSLNRRPYQFHRLLAQAFIPNPDGRPCVDHVDGDPKNNSLSNLRWATHAENARNRKKHRDNASDYRGVSFHTRNKKYQAQIRIDGKIKHLGYFHTPEEAQAAYEAVARKEHGEFFRDI